MMPRQLPSVEAVPSKDVYDHPSRRLVVDAVVPVAAWHCIARVPEGRSARHRLQPARGTWPSHLDHSDSYRDAASGPVDDMPVGCLSRDTRCPSGPIGHSTPFFFVALASAY